MESSFPFTSNIPYKLIKTGGSEPKPLCIYLHGYKQNISYFERKVDIILSLDAHHLLPQGPYPIYDEKHKRKVNNWGRAWYLYDGRQEQFKKSMEESTAFIDGIIEKVSDSIVYSNVVVLGYSMGGYLAGYYALSRPEVVDNLIVIGGRIKQEWFEGNRYDDLNVLALHGSQDRSVLEMSVMESSQALEKMGASVTFKTIEEGHRLNSRYIEVAKEWIQSVVS